MGLFKKSRNVVGLDIGSNAIKAVELKPGKGGTYQVVALGVEPLAPEAIVDGTILDAAVVIDTISKLFREARIKTKDVATSVSGNAVIIKKITLPLMTEDELAESIQWEAEQYIPFDIEDVNIDYQILGQGAENMDVLLVAAKKDKLNDYTSVISQAGLNPVLVDVDAFAVQGAYEANYDVPSDEVVALVNIGASIMNINILRNGTSVFWRDISSGGNKYTEEIQKELHLSQEQAEDLKRGRPVDGVPGGNAQPILAQVTQEIATEIQKTFDFFIATSNAERINRIILAGGSSKVSSLETVLGERFGARVEVLNPFEQVPATGKGVDPDLASENASQFGVAVGLALRVPGDSKINLLREKRAAGPKKATAPSEGLQPIHLALFLILLLAVGYMGYEYYRLSTEHTRLTNKQTELETEKRRLEPILAKKKALQEEKELLDRKINIIKELKAKQLYPVRLLDELSRNLPEYVWFTSLRQSQQTVMLDGGALNANKVADFLEALKSSGRIPPASCGHFCVPPNGEPSYAQAGGSVTFKLTVNFQPDPPVATPTAQAAGK
jgi:type IV pilus assembly protein PilM